MATFVCLCVLSTEVRHLQELLAEADRKGYSDSETGDELRASIEEAQKLADAALEITSGKKKGIVMSISTRGSSAVEKRMGLEELVDFMVQVESVPCRIPEADLLQVLLFLHVVGCLLFCCYCSSTLLLNYFSPSLKRMSCIVHKECVHDCAI